MKGKHEDGLAVGVSLGSKIRSAGPAMVNQPVRNPDPHGKTPEARGCVFHQYPTRAQRRLAARSERRTYATGKLSNNAQKNRYLRRAYELRCERRAHADAQEVIDQKRASQ